ncbi:hypothetical protein Tsubulata_048250, partial [Turnera subulata]
MRKLSSQTPLHCAVAGNHPSICLHLLENGANPNAVDAKGATPINYVAQGMQTSHSKLILTRHQYFHIMWSNFPRGFHGSYMILIFWNLSCGFVLNLTLLGCVLTEHGQLLQLLIKKGAKVDIDSIFGTPLQKAARGGNTKVISILLENNADGGADPNAPSFGLAPLEAANCAGSDITRCLVKAGANPNATNHLGLTPLEMAALRGHLGNAAVLFPDTAPIPDVSPWSLPGLVSYLFSEEVEQKIKQLEKKQILMYLSEGEAAFRRRNYLAAIYYYSEVIEKDPSNTAALSNRSRCWAILDEGFKALCDGQECIWERPMWPEGYYRTGVALKSVKKFSRAAKSFRLGLYYEPGGNEEMNRAA